MARSELRPLETLEDQVFHNSQSAVALSRFMIWALEEAEMNLGDEFVKAAISTIIHHMEQNYGTQKDHAH